MGALFVLVGDPVGEEFVTDGACVGSLVVTFVGAEVSVSTVVLKSKPNEELKINGPSIDSVGDIVGFEVRKSLSVLQTKQICFKTNANPNLNSKLKEMRNKKIAYDYIQHSPNSVIRSFWTKQPNPNSPATAENTRVKYAVVSTAQE